MRFNDYELECMEKTFQELISNYFGCLKNWNELEIFIKSEKNKLNLLDPTRNVLDKILLKMLEIELLRGNGLVEGEE